MADCAAIKAKLDAAQAAFDRLISGRAIRVVVDSDGSRIEYTSANQSKLYQYLQLLQAQYDACIGGTKPAVTKPLQFVF